jgi:hypothetical protein
MANKTNRKYTIVGSSSSSERWLLETKVSDPDVMTRLRGVLVDDTQGATPAFVMEEVSELNVVFYNKETESLFIMCDVGHIEAVTEIVTQRLDKKK